MSNAVETPVSGLLTSLAAASDPVEITGEAAAKMLVELSGSYIAGVKFVARGDEERSIAPYVRVMAFRRNIRKHLAQGRLPYNPLEHRVLPVYEMLDMDTARHRYQSDAQRVVIATEPLIVPAEGLLQTAEAQYREHATAARHNTVDIRTRRVAGLKARLELNRLKITDPAEALKLELTHRIENRGEEIGQLGVRIRDAEGTLQRRLEESPQDPEAVRVAQENLLKLNLKLEELHDRFERLTEYMRDPTQMLLSNYRMVNLDGLLALAIDHRVYVVTTEPTPAIPEDATPRTEDPYTD